MLADHDDRGKFMAKKTFKKIENLTILVGIVVFVSLVFVKGMFQTEIENLKKVDPKDI